MLRQHMNLAFVVIVMVLKTTKSQFYELEDTENKRKVNVPPLILEQPAKIIYFRVAHSIELPCVASGFPQPTYSWYMDNKLFDASGNDGRVAIQPGVGTLIFANPLTRDEGFYQCNATNEVGTAVSIKTFMRNAYLQQFPNTPTRNLRPQLGQSLKLKCVPPVSVPKPFVFWGIDDGSNLREIDESDRVTVDPEGNLHFANVMRDDFRDGGTYYCIVQNTETRKVTRGQDTIIDPQGQTEQYSATSVIWHTPGNQLLALRNKMASLICIFSGNPTPTVTWRRVQPPGSRLPPNHRYEKFGQELIIERVQFQDAGAYECEGQNVEGRNPVRRSTQLIVQAAPSWVKFPESIDASIGGTASFYCEGVGFPDPEHYWFVNGKRLTLAAQASSDRIIETNRLVFKNITRQDVMVIQCNVTNKHDYIFMNAYLNVLLEPAVIQDPPLKEQKAAEGQTVTLSCRVFGSPEPLVVWRKGSEQLTGGRYKILPDGHLKIMDVSLVDAGLYTCSASNKYASVDASGTLLVRRRTVIQTPPQPVMVEMGTEAKFTCTATTDPAEIQHLRILWKKDGNFINAKMAQRIYENDIDNSLTISGTNYLDTGKYTCVATNGIDEDEAGAQLIVQEPPDPPTKIEVKCTNHKRIANITWLPGRDHYAPILYYILQYNTSFSQDTWYDILPPVPRPKPNATEPPPEPLPGFLPNTTRYDVTLSPWGNYTFRLLARNKVGLSEPSRKSNTVCTTEPDVPFKNPENVIGEGDQPNNLVVFWTPMPQIEHNGPNFKYVVSWYRADDPDAVKSEPVSKVDAWHHVVENNLDRGDPFQKYYVKVKAHNSMGAANVEPDWIVGYSGEGEPKVAPVDLMVDPDSITDTMATLRWSHVDTAPDKLRGFFRGYRIQFGRINEWPETVREEDVIIEASRNQYPRPRWKRDIFPEIFNRTTGLVVVVLRHLPANSDIRIQVRVLNKYYVGPPSSPALEIRTKEGRPGPPVRLDVIARGSTYFELEWEAPKEPNGVLKGYHFSYQIVTGLNFGGLQYRAPIQNASMTRLRLTGLKPGTYYRVYLSAYTMSSYGERIFMDMNTLGAGVPGRPSFAITKLNETYALVQWEPSRSGNPGSVFFVEWRVNGQYPWQRTAPEYLSNHIPLTPLDPGTTYQIRVVATNGVGGEAPSEWLDVATPGAAPGEYTLSTQISFYGIFIALLLIIMMLILFFFARRQTEKNHQAKEEIIMKQMRDIQAREAADQLGVFNQDSHDYMFESQATLGTTGQAAPMGTTEDQIDRSYEVADDDGPELFEKNPIINREVEYPKGPEPYNPGYAPPGYGDVAQPQVRYHLGVPVPVHTSSSQQQLQPQQQQQQQQQPGYRYPEEEDTSAGYPLQRSTGERGSKDTFV